MKLHVDSAAPDNLIKLPYGFELELMQNPFKTRGIARMTAPGYL